MIPLKNATTPLIVEPGAVRDLTQSLGRDATILTIDTQPSTTQIADVIHTAQNGCTVIVPINDLNINKNQLKLVQDLVRVGNSVIVIAHRNPFDAARMPESVTTLISYGFNPPMREALADVLAGKIQPSGVLPVTLS